MPTIQYPNNPNIDTAFIKQDDGTKNRALMVAPQDISTLELPNNPNSTKGYVTIDGKKQRVVLTADISGNSGGDSHNLGWYETPTALNTAHPTAEAGDWAIVGSTDTVWVWDTDTSAWVDTDTKGEVTPDMIIVKSATMPSGSTVPAGAIYQYTGTTNATYTHGYIYENVTTTTSSSASATQTVGSGLSNILVDIDTLESFTGWTTDNSLQIFYTADGWSVDTTSLGVTYTGTPSVGDAITITYTAEVNTYAWTRIDVQPAPEALPSQTGQSGKFLTTDGTDASWSDKPLVNVATGNNALQILGTASSQSGLVAIGYGITITNTLGADNVLIGRNAGKNSSPDRAVCIGANTQASTNGVAIGRSARALATGAIQIGGDGGTNNDANTVKFYNANGNFEIMSADGTIPHARLTNALSSTTVTIAVADWNGGTTCSKTISGLTATSVVFVAPDNASQSDYLDAGVYASSQTTDTLTFTCTTTPTSALTVTVVYC